MHGSTAGWRKQEPLFSLFPSPAHHLCACCISWCPEAPLQWWFFLGRCDRVQTWLTESLVLEPELPPSESPSLCGMAAMPTVQLSHGRLGLPSHSHGSVPRAWISLWKMLHLFYRVQFHWNALHAWIFVNTSLGVQCLPESSVREDMCHRHVPSMQLYLRIIIY